MPLPKKSSTNLTTKEVFRIFQKAQPAELSKAAPVLLSGSENFFGKQPRFVENRTQEVSVIIIIECLQFNI